MNDDVFQSTNTDIISAHQVTGVPVFDRTGEKLGTVKDIFINKFNGHAEFAAIAFHGGLFGMEEKYHPLPWSSLKYDTRVQGFVVELDRPSLQNAPAYDARHLQADQAAWGNQVRDYFGGLATP